MRHRHYEVCFKCATDISYYRGQSLLAHGKVDNATRYEPEAVCLASGETNLYSQDYDLSKSNMLSVARMNKVSTWLQAWAIKAFFVGDSN